MSLLITSLQNPRVKLAHKLMEKRGRDKLDHFLIEGYRELLRASESGLVLEELFICPELFLGSNEEKLIATFSASGAEIIETNDKVFRALSYRDRPDGLIGIAKRPNWDLTSLAPSKNPFYIVAEAIEKPGNLGSILRSSDGAGVDGLIVCDECTDIFNPNVIRSSVGTLFTVPTVTASTQNTLAWLREKGVAIVAATPEAKVEFTKVDMKQPLAIVVGTEQYGLSQEWKEAATVKVSIPMLGKADSLNVATATTLLLYEVCRQRRS
jgi:TrmH family RNA methyltransferase